MITDPISDMLTRIRNAQSVKKPEVVLPMSQIKYDVEKILEKEGYVGEVTRVETGKFPQLRIVLRYQNQNPKIQKIARISTPGRRVYASYYSLPRVRSGMGIAIISTSNGLMTNEQARARHLGGEIICEVY